MEPKKYLNVMGVDRDLWQKFKMICLAENQSLGERLNWLLECDIKAQATTAMKYLRKERDKS